MYLRLTTSENYETIFGTLTYLKYFFIGTLFKILVNLKTCQSSA